MNTRRPVQSFGWILLAVLLTLQAADAAGAEPLLDYYADPLPPDAVARLGTVRFRHGEVIYALAYSPDGKRLASSSADGTIRLWDAATGKEVRRLAEQHRAVFCLAFSADGRTLATGGDGGSLSLWDTDSGKERQLQGHDGMVMGLGFTPDGAGLVAGGESKTIRLWSVRTGKLLRCFEMTDKQVCNVVLSPDGKLLAASGERQPILVWDLATGREVCRLDRIITGICCLAFSPDSKTLACSDGDNKLNLVNVADGKTIRTLSDYSAYTRLAFSPDGRFLAAAGEYTFLAVWETASGKKHTRVADGIEAIAAAFSPDGKTLATGGKDGRIRLWDVASGSERFANVPIAHGYLRFAGNGRSLFLRHAQGNLDQWDTASWKRVHRFEWPSAVRTQPGENPVTVSAHGGLVATGGQDGKVRLWDRASRTQRAAFQAHDHDVFGLRFVDGERLLSWGADRTVRLGVAATGKEQWRTPGQLIGGAALSPDGKLLAAGINGTQLGVWDMATGKVRFRLTTDFSPVSVAFSPDSTVVAVGAIGGSIRLWRADTGRPVGQLRDRTAWHITALAFSPDGRCLAAAARGKMPNFRYLPGGPTWTEAQAKDLPNIGLWEIASGKVRYRFHGHQNTIDALAFSPDGTLLVSTSKDTTALVWDVTGRCLQPARGDPLKPEELDAVWTDLASSDAARAWTAIRTLVDRPAHAVAWLSKRVEPAAPPDARQLARWIADLDSDDFATRQKASWALEKLGPASEPALRKALAHCPSAEMERRIRQLLVRFERLTLPDEQLRSERVLEALERMGTPEARQLVARLASGAPGALLARGAKAVLARPWSRASRCEPARAGQIRWKGPTR